MRSLLGKPFSPERGAYLTGVAVLGLAIVWAAGRLVLVAVVVSALSLSSFFGIRSGVRAARVGEWSRPRTWLALGTGCVPAGLTGVSVVYLAALFSGFGLFPREACEFRRGVPYDDAYVEAHAEESQHWFPLHAQCNAHVDLIPPWVNPAIVAFAVLTSLGLLCIVAAMAASTPWFGRRRPRAADR